MTENGWKLVEAAMHFMKKISSRLDYYSARLWVKCAQFCFIFCFNFFFIFCFTKLHFFSLSFFFVFCRVLKWISARNGTDDDFLSAFDVSIASVWLMTDTDRFLFPEPKAKRTRNEPKLIAQEPLTRLKLFFAQT